MVGCGVDNGDRILSTVVARRGKRGIYFFCIKRYCPACPLVCTIDEWYHCFLRWNLVLWNECWFWVVVSLLNATITSTVREGTFLKGDVDWTSL